MHTRCANPECQAFRHSFCEGRLFQFEIVSISVAASDDSSQPFDEKPERKTAHFWLCETCASKMSLELDPVNGLQFVASKEGERRPEPRPKPAAKIQFRNHW